MSRGSNFLRSVLAITASAVVVAGCSGASESAGPASSSSALSTTSTSVVESSSPTSVEGATPTSNETTTGNGGTTGETPSPAMSALRGAASRAGLPCGDDAWMKDYTPLKGADQHGYCGNAALLVTYVDEMFNGSDALLVLSQRQIDAAAAGHPAPSVFTGPDGSNWYMLCAATHEAKCRQVEGAVFLR